MNIKIRQYGEGRQLIVDANLFARGMHSPHDEWAEGDYNYWKPFCGTPYLHLCIVEENGKLRGWMEVHDGDDYDVGELYEDLTIEKVKELINWVKDHEWAEIEFNYYDALRLTQVQL